MKRTGSKYKRGDPVYWLCESYTGGHLDNVVLFKGEVKAILLEESDEGCRISYKVQSTYGLHRGHKDWQVESTTAHKAEDFLFSSQKEAKEVFSARSKTVSIEALKGLIYTEELRANGIKRDIEWHETQIVKLKQDQMESDRTLFQFKQELENLKK